MANRNGKVSNKSWADIPAVDPDELDLEMLAEIERRDGSNEFISAEEVSDRLKEVRSERKKKGDLHVRIASSLHEEIGHKSKSIRRNGFGLLCRRKTQLKPR